MKTSAYFARVVTAIALALPVQTGLAAASYAEEPVPSYGEPVAPSYVEEIGSDPAGAQGRMGPALFAGYWDDEHPPTTEEMIARINSERAARGYVPLVWNATLAAVANQCIQVSCSGNGWTINGLSIWDAITNAGYQWQDAGAQVALANFPHFWEHEKVMDPDFRDLGMYHNGAWWLIIVAEPVPPNPVPLGRVESLTLTGNSVTVKGWAFDPDTTSPGQVEISVNGQVQTWATAAEIRNDVNVTYGRPAGSPSGFWATISGLVPGTNAICISMQNYPDSATVRLDCGQVMVNNAMTVYRLYDPKTGEHLWSGSWIEYDKLSNGGGWQGQGAAWMAPASGQPVYRMFNTRTNGHLYTGNGAEIASLSALGYWNNEGVVFFSGAATGQPVNRLYNPGFAGGKHPHLLSKDSGEINKLIGQGWKNEGIAFYALN